MKSSRHRRHILAIVAATAMVGLGAGVVPHLATATAPHPANLGVPVAAVTAPSSLPVSSPACAPTCDLYAKAGTVTAGGSGPIPIWGFTTDDTQGGKLGGDPANTFIINEGQTLTLTLHNELPAGAGSLSLEVPAVQGLPDLTGVAEASSSVTPYTFGPLAPGTYVYQAGATPDQPRQLAMGLAAIIIVRPSDYNASAPAAYAGGLGAFAAEALVVMNEIDPAFNADPVNSDVEDYNPHYFFINGKAHPDTVDISADAGTTVLLRGANLGIRDRALGLVNSRMTLIGDDSQQLPASHQVNLESQLLTAGQVADLTTLIDPSAPVGAQFPVLDLDRNLNNGYEPTVVTPNPGGNLTFIAVVGTPVPAGAPSARVTSLTPATDDGTADVTVGYTVTGTSTSVSWYLDDLGGLCGGTTTASPQTLTIAMLSTPACAPHWHTGDHVIWIQPVDGATVGSAGGDVFTLALEGPTVSGLAVDPQFAHLTPNKTDFTPPGSTDVLLTGSAEPSLLDRTIDQAQGCLVLPADGDPNLCPVADQVSVALGDATAPSHAQPLSARIPEASLPTVNGTNTIHVRVHETDGTASRWSPWGATGSSVDVVHDTTGPTVDGIVASPNPVGAGNYPGNLNFLESTRITAELHDTLSPLADAELFIGKPSDPAPTSAEYGTGSELRPRDGQWLDDLSVRDREAYLEVPVSELQSYDEGTVNVYIHAKDAAGNWGALTTFPLTIDKTNPTIVGTPLDVPGSHHYPNQDETGAWVLEAGTIQVNATDPVGPGGVAQLPLETSGTQHVQVRYHVSSVQGTIGAAGAGIFYQTAQSALGTVTANASGTYTLRFDWHFIETPPLPPEATTSVWVWVLDEAGNPSVPVEVPVGPATNPVQIP